MKHGITNKQKKINLLTEAAFNSIFEALLLQDNPSAKGSITAEYYNDMRPQQPCSCKATMTVEYEFTEYSEEMTDER